MDPDEGVRTKTINWIHPQGSEQEELITKLFPKKNSASLAVVGMERMETGRDYSSFSSFSFLQGICRSGHQTDYTLRETTGGEPVLCGLCFLMDGFSREVPFRIHAHRLLAENGNPETSPQFLSHLQLAMGLKAPPRGMSLKQYSLARRQYSRPAPGQFPITSALWQMMGYQPPLAVPLLYRLLGLPEAEIATYMELSQYNVHLRLAKGVRLCLRFVRHDSKKEKARIVNNSSGWADDGTYQEQVASG